MNGIPKLLALCLVALMPLGALAQSKPFNSRNMPRSSDGQNFGGQQTQKQPSDDWRRQQDNADAQRTVDQQKWQRRDDEWRRPRDEQSRQERTEEPHPLPLDGGAPR